jgi:hypothetical protein
MDELDLINKWRRYFMVRSKKDISWRIYLIASLLFGVLMGVISVFLNGAFLLVFSVFAWVILMFGGLPRKGAGSLRLYIFYSSLISTTIAWAIFLIFS